MLSSPPKKKGTWFARELAVTDGSVKNIVAELICNECRANPNPSVKASCLHKKPRGNKLKSSKVRKSDSKATGTSIMATLRESAGYLDEESGGWYPKQHLDAFFSSFVEPPKDPSFHFLFFDPNAGGMNHTAYVGGTVVGGVYYICGFDTKQTAEFDQFNDFILNNIKEYHVKIRKFRHIPLVCAIESQKSWDGCAFKERICMLLKEGDRDFENVYFLSDEQKQKDNTIRYGVNVNAKRLNQMAYRLSSVFSSYAIKIHPKWATCHTYGRDELLKEFKEQMKRFKHFEEDENSVFTTSGKRRKNNSGKEGLLNDDISDCLHGLVFWTHALCYNNIYRDQKRQFGIFGDAFN